MRVGQGYVYNSVKSCNTFKKCKFFYTKNKLTIDYLSYERVLTLLKLSFNSYDEKTLFWELYFGGTRYPYEKMDPPLIVLGGGGVGAL